jgi:NAD(P) transhydrogenase
LSDKFDIIVIGSGPAGRRAAIQAAKLGRSVLVVENRKRVGGVSAHTGTLPSKTIRETVLNLSGYRERAFYGQNNGDLEKINEQDLKSRLDMTIDHEVQILDDQFYRNNVTITFGHAHFISKKMIVVTDCESKTTSYEADFIIIAVGSTPYRPLNIPFDGVHILDSDDIINFAKLPRSLTVVGAGVIGVEYATIFSALNVKVTLVEPRKNFLEFVDREIIETFKSDISARGIELKIGVTVTEVRKSGASSVISQLDDGQSIESEALLFSGGRIGMTNRLGLGFCGLSADNRGRIAVNPATYQTKISNIYAVGDVIGFPSLASISMEQGRVAACHAILSEIPNSTGFYPYGIYSVPEISAIGLNEQEVQARNIPYQCGRAQFKETTRGHILGIGSGVLKLIFSKSDRKLLGAHIIGEGATELIHIGQAVINLGGTLDYLVESAFNYPTLAEAYKIAALDAFNHMQLAA